jgi:hypothetical protein
MAERRVATTIDHVCAAAYRIPTDRLEADGTLSWTSTTLVIIYVFAGNARGLGYTYGHALSVALVKDLLASAINDHDCLDVPGCWMAMQRTVRNVGPCPYRANAA